MEAGGVRLMASWEAQAIMTREALESQGAVFPIALEATDAAGALVMAQFVDKDGSSVTVQRSKGAIVWPVRVSYDNGRGECLGSFLVTEAMTVNA